MDIPQALLWINGQTRAASTKESFEVHNPLTKKIVSISASANSADCKDAVEAAAHAFASWEQVNSAEKRAIFFKAADLLESERYVQNIIQAIQDETASEKSYILGELSMSAGLLRDAAGLASEVRGEMYPSCAIPGAEVFVQRRAHGVIFSIAPWNGPIVLIIRAFAVPLICGNTVVVKSSGYSPRSQAIVIELLHEAGIPPGVLNLISMSREDAPKLTAEIIGNPHVRHINFTGSDNVGKIIAAEASKYLKPCVFELGGKAPAIVLEDANIPEAARSITWGAMVHSGQVCMSTERVIVQRNVAAALQSELVTLCGRLTAGDHINDPSVKLSCLFCESSAANVLSMITEAKSAGAQVLLGDMKNDSAVIQPHILSGVKPGMRAWDRESFGPVIVISVVDTIDEAVDLSNAFDYSLTASVWTKDKFKGLEVARRIRTGCAIVNGPTFVYEPAFGHAGLGGATGYGRFDIENFTVKRAVIINSSPSVYPLVE